MSLLIKQKKRKRKRRKTSSQQGCVHVRDEYRENIDECNYAITAHVSVVFHRADDITAEEKKIA